MSTGGFAGQPSADMPSIKQQMTVEVDLDISELIFGDLSNTDDVRKVVVAAVEKVLKADAMTNTVKVLAVEDHHERTEIRSRMAQQSAYNMGVSAQQNMAIQRYQAIQNQMGIQSLQQLNSLAGPSGLSVPHQWQSIPTQPAAPPVNIIRRALNKIKGK